MDQQSSGLDIILSANGMSLITGKMYYEGSYGNGTIEIPESGEISVSNNNVRVMITGRVDMFCSTTIHLTQILILI